MSTVPAYSISTESIAKEQARAGSDLAAFDVSNVLGLDELELPAVGPNDVRMKILAVSAEHNIDHATTADTVNIADQRGGKIYPGNSATGEVLEVGANVTKFAPGDIVITHCNGAPDEYGYPTRIWAYDAEDSIGWYAKEAVVGDWQLIKAPLACGLNLWEILLDAGQGRGASRILLFRKSGAPRRPGEARNPRHRSGGIQPLRQP